MLDFRRRLQAGLIRSPKYPAYLKWVRSLECCACGAPADDAHHRYGYGWIKGAGTKVADIHALPLCRTHHDELHASPLEWEERHGSQWFWIALTIQRAVAEGVIEIAV